MKFININIIKPIQVSVVSVSADNVILKTDIGNIASTVVGDLASLKPFIGKKVKLYQAADGTHTLELIKTVESAKPRATGSTRRIAETFL